MPGIFERDKDVCVPQPVHDRAVRLGLGVQNRGVCVEAGAGAANSHLR